MLDLLLGLVEVLKLCLWKAFRLMSLFNVFYLRIFIGRYTLLILQSQLVLPVLWKNQEAAITWLGIIPAWVAA